MGAFWQLYLANFKEFMRDRMSMFWVLAFPLFFIVLFGIIFSGDSAPSYDLGVADEDGGRVGTAITQGLSSVEIFKVQTGARADLLSTLQNGDLDLVVVVPAGTSDTVAAGQPSGVQAHYDPTNQAVGNLVLGVVDQVIAGIDRSITERPILLTVEPVSVLPQRVGQLDYILPGILGMALMQIGLFGTATAMVQLREQQVLRRLAATPLSRAALLASQIAFRLTLALIQTALILGLGILVFHVSIAGNLLVLVGFVLLGALAFIALGYLVSSLSRTVDSANGLTQAINFPMMFLSGLFFPLSLLPGWIRPVTHALPLTYLADALRQVMVGATPTYPLGLDLAVLAAWLAACTLLSVRLFRWD
jgi:ABC-2 type transport system permease protein